MTNAHITLLKVSAVLWVIWGLVHTFAGVMILSVDTAAGFQAIADAVQPDTWAMEYPAAVGGILNQHGWNLAWIGVVTMVGAVLIWRKSLIAIWVTAMVGGLTDVGYFLSANRRCPVL